MKTHCWIAIFSLDTNSEESLSYAPMIGKKVAYSGFTLALVGALLLAYGGVGYTKQERLMELGLFDPMQDLPVKGSVPLWGGGLLMAAGGALVAAAFRMPQSSSARPEEGMHHSRSHRSRSGSSAHHRRRSRRKGLLDSGQ